MWQNGFIASMVSLVIGLVIGWLLTKHIYSPIEVGPVVISDTVTIHDTTYIEKHTKPIKPLPPDTIWIHTYDTLVDSILVEIPIEQKEYRDTIKTDSSHIELGVKFSGYKAKIDSVGLDYHFSVEPQVIEKKKGWGQFIGIGVGIGYGMSVVNTQPLLAPQVGINIVYGFGYHW